MPVALCNKRRCGPGSTTTAWRRAATTKQWDLRLCTTNPRSGRPLQIDGKQRARITALACSAPPWATPRRSALAGRQGGGVGLCAAGIAQCQNHTQKHLKKSWCLSTAVSGSHGATASSLCFCLTMLCLTCFDAGYPVVCFDERPCCMIGDTMTPLPTQPGKVAKEHMAKEHYAYTKHGSCCLLAAVEPLTAKRTARLEKQRTGSAGASMLCSSKTWRPLS